MRGLALKQTVESLFEVVKDRSTPEELCFICPQPGCSDITGNRSVNLKSGKTSCWKCGKGGDFARWANFLGYEIADEGSWQAEPLEDLDLSARREVETPLPVVQDVRLPAGFTFCHQRPASVYTELVSEMAERKHLAREDFFAAKVGFTKTDPKWEPYAIFPVFEYGRTVYWQGRTYVDVPGEPTKRFPGRAEVPSGAKFWVYGIDELRTSKAPIALVMESILNVLSMRRFFQEQHISGITPVCVFKHYLSRPQAHKLIEIPSVQEICLLYDHDATRASWEKSPMISDRKSVTLAEMPSGVGGEKNDPNDDPEAAWAAIEAREISTSLSALKFQVDLARSVPKRQPILFSPEADNPLDNLDL